MYINTVAKNVSTLISRPVQTAVIRKCQKTIALMEAMDAVYNTLVAIRNITAAADVKAKTRPRLFCHSGKINKTNHLKNKSFIKTSIQKINADIPSCTKDIFRISRDIFRILHAHK